MTPAGLPPNDKAPARPARAEQHPEVAAMFARHGSAYRWWAVFTAMLGTVAAVMEATIVNVALPEIIRVFAIGHDQVQLLSTGFLAATTVSMLLSHWAIQRFGIRRTYIAAVVLLLSFSIAAVLAPNFAALALCRIVQGIVAGLIQPLAMVVIADLFPPQERGRAMSAYGLGIVLSPAIGPVAGGLLVDHFGWRAVFLVTVPFCLAAMLLAPRFIIRGRQDAATRQPLDLIGIVLLSAALLTGLGGLSSVFAEPRMAALALACGALFGVIFFAWERQTPYPLLDLRIFRHRGFGAAALVSVAYGVGIYGSTYLGPLFAQDAFGFSASQAGAMLLPGGITLAVSLLAAGVLADRFPAYRVAMAGLACFAASALLLGLSAAGTGFWLLAAWIALGRAGLGLIIPGLNAAAFRLLPFGSESAGAAAISFFRQLGGTFGVMLIALFLEARQRPGFAAPPLQAMQEGFFLIAVAYGLALLAARRMRPPATA